jgi:carbamoyltransferase
MIILGICNDETASACLFKDGRLIAASSEERFSRKKMDNSFPSHSIKYVLQEANIPLSEVDNIAYSWSKGLDKSLLKKYEERRNLAEKKGVNSFKIFLERREWDQKRDLIVRQEFDQWVDKNIDLSNTEVLDYFHHEAHASSAALMSPFDNGIVLTADGRGDGESTTIWSFNRNDPQCLSKIYSSFSCDSLGYFYGRITGILGFKPMRHEGKITGLAAYGNPLIALPIMKKMIEVKEGKLIGNLGDYYRPFFSPYSDQLIKELLPFSREDIAAAAQLHLENCLYELLDFHLKNNEPKASNLMLAGGVFGNVKATHVLKNHPRINQVFVQPQMGDGGLCIGAAALLAKQKGLNISAISNTYLGPSIEEESLDALTKELFDITNCDNIEKLICKDLMDENVIGFARGRMEFGPRALCHRSILYKTSDKSINDWLNKRMNRTEFMPFAPVIREETAFKAFKGFSTLDSTLQYMTSTIECTEEFIASCPSVAHIDGTARPQIIKKSEDPLMWNILDSWEKLSGEMSLVNTSFNAHEEPIVCNVNDCLKSLESGMIDILYLGNKRIKRK